MPGLTKNDWKGLWAILWRTVVFGPVICVGALLGVSMILLTGCDETMG
jgi:hypothetical protein